MKAIDAFFFIGLQEAYEISVELLVREINQMNLQNQSNVQVPLIKKERDQSNEKIVQQKLKIKNNENVMNRAKELNRFDLEVYQKCVKKFCNTIMKHEDLLNKLKATTKIRCD